jgi:hypothetical protein
MLQLGVDAVGVAEDDGGREAVARERGCLFEHAGGSTPVAADARPEELLCLLGEAECSRVDLVLQSRPAREPVFTRQRELSGGQRERVGDRPEPGDRIGVSGPGGTEEVLRLAAELSKVGVGGECWGAIRAT